MTRYPPQNSGSGTGPPPNRAASSAWRRSSSSRDAITSLCRETQAPIKGAHVLMHPYRAFTDDRGAATLKVVKGRYTLFVSGLTYIGHESIVDVAADLTVRAELTVEPESDDDHVW